MAREGERHVTHYRLGERVTGGCPQDRTFGNLAGFARAGGSGLTPQAMPQRQQRTSPSTDVRVHIESEEGI